MWLSFTWFSSPANLHTLHETTSNGVIEWSHPSPAQLKNVYAPTIFKEGDLYKMWYSDVSEAPWTVAFATSNDGQNWYVHPDPVLELNQEWERERLFYPTFIKVDDVYLMWYGSYWTERENTTALGLAVSLDGINWTKNTYNPVLKPNPDRP